MRSRSGPKGSRRPGPRASTRSSCAGSSISSASSRSIRSTCSCGRTTCPRSAGSAATTRRCSIATRTARRARCSSTGATKRRCCRSRCSRCFAGGWSARASTRGDACGGSRRKQPTFVADVLALVAERGPISASEIELGGRPSRKGWWEWSRREDRDRVAVLERPGHERAAARLRAALRSSRARAAREGPRSDRRRANADAQRALIERAARALGIATRVRPARLLPAAARWCAHRGRASSSRPARSSTSTRRGLDQARHTCIATRQRRRASTPIALLCCRRSTRSCGFAIAPRGCSA